MPTFDFRCPKCLLTIERQIPRVNGMVSTQVLMCPSCMGTAMERQLSAPARIHVN
jgi:putative FmdB family regulatory protein